MPRCNKDKKPYTRHRPKKIKKRSKQNQKLIEQVKSKPSQYEVKKKSNRKIVLDVKINGSCVDCGQTNPFLLEFDHIKTKTPDRAPQKKFVIGDSVTCKTPTALKEEMDKCELRCANCHRIKTLYENGSYRSTGHRLLLLQYIEDYFDDIMGEHYSPSWYDTSEYDRLYKKNKK